MVMATGTAATAAIALSSVMQTRIDRQRQPAATLRQVGVVTTAATTVGLVLPPMLLPLLLLLLPLLLLLLPRKIVWNSCKRSSGLCRRT